MFSLKFSELMPEGVVLEFDSFYKRLNRFLRESFNDDGTLITAPPAQISDLGLPVGTLIPYAGSTIPTGWLLCDGTAISRSTYSTLFDVISTTYGVGDGSTTFTLPDLRQKFPLGKAASGTGSTLGSSGGAIDHTHTGPSHTHAISSDGAHTHTGPSHTHTISSDGDHTHTTVVPRGGWGTGGGASSGRLETSDGLALPVGVSTASADQTVTSSTNGAHTHTGSTGASGTGATSSSGSHDHGAVTGSAGAGTTGTSNPPYIALNYLILYS